MRDHSFNKTLKSELIIPHSKITNKHSERIQHHNNQIQKAIRESFFIIY